MLEREYGDCINTLTELPRAGGEALAQITIKQHPADFRVREVIGFEFDGEGEHLYLRIRKCALNTGDIVEALQDRFACSPVDIGVSGLKDRHAITDQWVSLRTPRCIADAALPVIEEQHDPQPGQYAVVEARRHSRKLRRGAHKGNAFRIVLRELKPLVDDHRVRIAAATQVLDSTGFPNYFGPQRFGIGGQNIRKAVQHFRYPKRKLSRTRRSLYLSAARSSLFNAVCAARVADGSWNTPVHGEPLVLGDTFSYFLFDGQDASVAARIAAGDIHTSGPMWGRGAVISSAGCEVLEREALTNSQEICTGLEQAGLQMQRRALRAMPGNLNLTWLDPSTCELSVRLSTGVYASSLLGELFQLRHQNQAEQE